MNGEETSGLLVERKTVKYKIKNSQKGGGGGGINQFPISYLFERNGGGGGSNSHRSAIPSILLYVEGGNENVYICT